MMRGYTQLQCPNGCTAGRFEALNAPLIVDRQGRYLTHDATQATYVCETCQSVAIDLVGAARQMVRDGELEDGGEHTLTCPACGMEMLPPEDDPFATMVECPDCGTRFQVDEGVTRLSE
jgi:DNA-directed RNA polymerase subunit RPC12/RpoP